MMLLYITVSSFIILIPIWIKLLKFSKKNKEDKELAGLLGLFSMFLIPIISVLFWGWISDIGTTREIVLDSIIVEETEKEIVNLNINSTTEGNISGGFFVGIGGLSGSISSNEYYYFYTKIDDKYKLEKVSAKDVSIIEYDGKPKITYRKEELKKITKVTYGDIARTLKIGTIEEINNSNIDNDDRSKLGYDPYYDTKEETTLYIPKNSITTEFKPNLD